MRSVDVVIPAFRPGRSFELLLDRLQRQSVKPGKIIVMNTGKSLWDEAEIDKTPFVFGKLAGISMELHHVGQTEFDHGGTRSLGAGFSTAEALLFMTQDAVPADRFLIERLLLALDQAQDIGVAYARQIPAPGCKFLERMTREFNYGKESRVKRAGDLPELGIKTYFCSNVCALYRRDLFDLLGGFAHPTIFNEDMLFAAGLIRAGYAVAYAADARVIHSHNYTGIQQLRRNFDLAVSQADHPEVFEGIRSEKEGIRMVKSCVKRLVRRGELLQIPVLFWQSACKYLGYCLGKRYRSLPGGLVLRCTSNPSYWKKDFSRKNTD